MTTPKRKSDGEHHAKNPHPLFLAAEIPVEVELSYIGTLMVLRSDGSSPKFEATLQPGDLIEPSQIRARFGGGRFMVRAVANDTAASLGARTTGGDAVRAGTIIACGVFTFDGPPKSAQVVESGRVHVMAPNTFGSIMEHLPAGISALGLLAKTISDSAREAREERREEQERREKRDAAERAEKEAERDRREKRDTDEREERRAERSREQARLDADLRARDDDRRAAQAAKDAQDREDQRVRSEQQMAMFRETLQSRGGDNGQLTQTLLSAVLAQNGSGKGGPLGFEEAMKVADRVAKIRDDKEAADTMGVVMKVIEHIGPTDAGQGLIRSITSLLPGSGGQPPMPQAVDVPQMNGAAPIN